VCENKENDNKPQIYTGSPKKYSVFITLLKFRIPSKYRCEVLSRALERA